MAVISASLLIWHFSLWACLYVQISPLYKNAGGVGLGLTLLQNDLIKLTISAVTSFPNEVLCGDSMVLIHTDGKRNHAEFK